jgi:hypothetical protein
MGFYRQWIRVHPKSWQSPKPYTTMDSCSWLWRKYITSEEQMCPEVNDYLSQGIHCFHISPARKHNRGGCASRAQVRTLPESVSGKGSDIWPDKIGADRTNFPCRVLMIK